MFARPDESSRQRDSGGLYHTQIRELGVATQRHEQLFEQLLLHCSTAVGMPPRSRPRGLVCRWLRTTDNNEDIGPRRALSPVLRMRAPCPAETVLEVPELPPWAIVHPAARSCHDPDAGRRRTRPAVSTAVSTYVSESTVREHGSGPSPWPWSGRFSATASWTFTAGGRYFAHSPGHLSNREFLCCCSITEIVRMLWRILDNRRAPDEGWCRRYV